MLPPSILKAIKSGLPILDTQWRGEFLQDAVLIGPEMRGSSPVRIERDPATFEIPALPGSILSAKRAGYAGGIVTAAVDGLRAARKIITKHRAPDA